MTTYFVSRHPGALDWASQEGIKVDRQVAHLLINEIHSGDVVLGTLPVQLAAQVCQRGARYLHLSLDIPEALRGKDLTASDMRACRARLEAFHIEALP